MKTKILLPFLILAKMQSAHAALNDDALMTTQPITPQVTEPLQSITIFAQCLFLDGNATPAYYEIEVNGHIEDNSLYQRIANNINDLFIDAIQQGKIDSEVNQPLRLSIQQEFAKYEALSGPFELHFERDGSLGCSTEEPSEEAIFEPVIDNYSLCFYSIMYEKYVEASGQLVRYIDGEPNQDHKADLNYFHDLIFRNFEGFTEAHLDGRAPTKADTKTLKNHISDNLFEFNQYAASPVEDFLITYKILEPVTCKVDYIPSPR